MMGLVRKLSMLASIGVFALLSACGNDDQSSADGAASTADTAVEAPPDDAATDRGSGDGRVVTPQAGMENLVEAEIVEATVDHPTFVVWFLSDGVEPCWVVDSVDIDETDDAVTVTVRGGSDPAEPEAICIEIGELLGVEIPIALNGRDVIDGSNGATIPTRG